MANVRKMIETVVMDVLLSINFAAGDGAANKQTNILKRQSAANS
jgi:hypothetical protein